MRYRFLLVFIIGYAGTVWADEFSEFRVPKNKVVRTTLNFNTMFKRTTGDGEYPTYGHSNNIEQDGEANFFHFQRLQTDEKTTSVMFSGGLSEALSRYNSFSDNLLGDYRSENSHRGYSFGASASARFERDWYVWDDKFAFSGMVYGRASYSGSGRESTEYSRNFSYYYGNTENWREDERESWDQRYGFNIDFGPTIGRIRDVTSVANVLAMEQRLIEEGVLSGRLSDANRLAVAGIFYQQDSYGSRYSRYRKYFWRDIENIVKQDSAFFRSIDAYAQNRIAESYVGQVSRYRGFAITPTMFYSHTHEIRHSSQYGVYEMLTDSSYTGGVTDNYSRWEDFGDQFGYGAALNYAVPFGFAWQYNLGSSFTHDPESNYSWGPHTQTWDARINTSLHWIMADRWISRASFDIRGTWIDEVGDNTRNETYITSQMSYEVSYLIEDRISISARLFDNYAWSEDRQEYNYYRYWDIIDGRWTEFRIGLTYALRGPAESYYYYPY